MSFSDVDRELLRRCLDRHGGAWNDFVDRFVGLVIHVVNRTSLGRGHSINEATRDDLVSEVFLVFLRNDFAVLRRFRRQCSLATYLTVVARRVVVRELLRLESNPASVSANGNPRTVDLNETVSGGEDPIRRIENVEQLEALLTRLDQREASIVRMFHLEGKSYREIGQAIGIAENSVGPVLHRAREKMRR
ncbi:MAG: sigma-70 family RNA polymerase sigma factor [Planctomycetota bacterium]